MADKSVHVRTTRAALRQALSTVASDAAASEAILKRVGLVALGRIRKAFVAKARGGTDEAGESWQPLSPKTVAYSRRGRTRAEKKRDARPSQALTKRQADRWWEVYSRWIAIFRKRRSGSKGWAAAIAWKVLKAEGATTLFDKYAHRQVEILRDTGLLFNSLSPGHSDNVSQVEGQAVVVGTNVPYATAHHEGVLGRLLRRRLWPPPSKWPQSWWTDIMDEVKRGLLEVAMQLIRGAR